MRRFLPLLAGLLLPIGSLPAEITGAQRIDIAIGTSLSLQAYNGPDVDIAVTAYQMHTVSFLLVDNENAVPVARTNINSVEVNSSNATVRGSNHIELRAPTTARSVGVSFGGFAVQNSNREAYLLYSHPSGIFVYWFDVLDTKQNECALLIVPAPRPASEAALLSAAAKIKAIDDLEASGVLSRGEALAKRASVTSER